MNKKTYHDALKWIVDILNHNKIKFNVMGGIAAHAYGSKLRFNDIDLTMKLRDMKKLEKLEKDHLILKPWNGISSNKIWKGYIMKLKYKGILIEITEAENTKIFNKKTGEYEKFPADLKNSKPKNLFGMRVPVMSKKNLIYYKSVLRFPNDLIDLKSIAKKPR